MIVRVVSADKGSVIARLLSDFFEQLLSLSRCPDRADAPGDASPECVAERRRAPRKPVSQAALIEWLDDDNQPHAEPCRVVDRFADGMELGLDRPLPAGWPILITPADEIPLKAVIRHARENGDGPRAGVMLIRHERRRFDRRPCEWRARLRWQVDADSDCVEEDARIVDAAEGGLRTRISRPVPEGVLVRVSHEGWHRFGAVASCRPAGSSYEAGLQFLGPPRPDGALEYQD